MVASQLSLKKANPIPGKMIHLDERAYLSAESWFNSTNFPSKSGEPPPFGWCWNPMNNGMFTTNLNWWVYRISAINSMTGPETRHFVGFQRKSVIRISKVLRSLHDFAGVNAHLWRGGWLDHAGFWILQKKRPWKHIPGLPPPLKQWLTQFRWLKPLGKQ